MTRKPAISVERDGNRINVYIEAGSDSTSALAFFMNLALRAYAGQYALKHYLEENKIPVKEDRYNELWDEGFAKALEPDKNASPEMIEFLRILRSAAPS